VTRAIASVVVAGAVVAIGACGLDVAATGGAGGPVEAGLDTNVPPRLDASSRTDGGDAAQGACSAEETVCGDACTDLKADPLNCGMCGKTCAEGQTCDEGKCTVLCVADKTKCNDTCVDLASDPAHCGSCDKACEPGLLCAAKSCVTSCELPLERCGGGEDGGADAGGPGYCADKKTDRNNCGACGRVCQQNEVCTAGACTPVCVTTARIGDVFGPTMVGCVAKVGFSSRASVCPAGTKVCSGQDWVNRRGTKVPSYNYWTNDDLRWSGQDGNCLASTSIGQLCGQFTATPMRVCGKKTDPVGNSCRWTGCGFGAARQPSQYFGGCEGNTSAGTLCCAP
jgi:Stigma-specific protein, Stig1